MNDDINKKEIKIKMGAVVFSDLLTTKETSARLVGVGRMNLGIQKTKSSVHKVENEAKLEEVEEQSIPTDTYTKEDLEREGNESLF